MATNQDAREIYWLLLLGSSAEQDQPQEKQWENAAVFFYALCRWQGSGEGIDIFNVHCIPDARLETSHTVSEIVIALILQVRKQRLNHTPRVTQLVKRCLPLLDPAEGFH